MPEDASRRLDNEYMMPLRKTPLLPPPLWTLLGCGALGGVFASLLEQSGQRVQVLLRDAQRSRLHPDFDFIALDSSHHLLGITRCFTDQVASIRRLLVMTKAHQVITALTPLVGKLSPAVPIVLLHNGMGVAEQVARLFPDNPLLVGVTNHGAMRCGHFAYRHTGKGETWVGPFNDAAKAYQSLADDLARALGDAGWDEDIRQRQWQKLAINCMVNPLTALHKVKNGELATPRFADALDQLSVELCDVMLAEGLHASAEELKRRTITVCELTADNHSSMLQDMEAGRLTEIESITGFLLARADAHDIAVPVNRSLYHAIKEKQA